METGQLREPVIEKWYALRVCITGIIPERNKQNLALAKCGKKSQNNAHALHLTRQQAAMCYSVRSHYAIHLFTGRAGRLASLAATITAIGRRPRYQ